MENSTFAGDYFFRLCYTCPHMARILFLEPFYGGSHRNFADNLVRYSTHDIELHTLPSRFWKWRMRGAALHFYSEITDPSRYDLLLVSGLMSLSDLKSPWGADCPPALLYMHESQLSYPLPEGGQMDYQFGFTDITSALNADRILFNSNFHKTAFFSELPVFLNRMPEYVPKWIPEVLQKKSETVYPGVENPSGSGEIIAPDGPPVIVWNHRWEFDKQPEVFFTAVDRLASDGIDFKLSLLGENFRTVPDAFSEAQKRHASRIINFGWVKNRAEYREALRRGSIVVSTAIQENFGISTAEAILAGCIPLLPDRLVYPELLPARFHKQFLYSNDEDLYVKLKKNILNPPATDIRTTLAGHYRQYCWENSVRRYDDIFTETAGI